MQYFTEDQLNALDRLMGAVTTWSSEKFSRIPGDEKSAIQAVNQLKHVVHKIDRNRMDPVHQAELLLVLLDLVRLTGQDARYLLTVADWWIDELQRPIHQRAKATQSAG